MPGIIGMKSGKMKTQPKWNHKWLTHIDARSELGYALKQRLQALEHDVSAGDPDRLTYAQRSLIRRALWLEVRLETDEVKIVTGDPIPAGSHSTLLNALTAVYRTLGVEPKAKASQIAQRLHRRARGLVVIGRPIFQHFEIRALATHSSSKFFME